MSFKDQKELRIEYDYTTRHEVDFAVFAQHMTKLIDANIVDKEYRTWIIPDFSTTTDEDTVVASILMMASMQKFFSYTCGPTCGIPSVTLLGEKADYERIVQKLDKLSTLGEEPTQFAALLRPILTRMVRTFEDPTDAAVVDFWQRILDMRRGSGFTSYSGWVTGFCFWDTDGKCLYPHAFGSREGNPRYTIGMQLDGVAYHSVSDKNVTPGWAKVPVKIVERSGLEVKSEMVAGSVGIVCSSSGEGTGLDSMQPKTGWWIYETE